VGRRLILDTNVLIAYERETLDRATLDDDEIAIAAVSVAEYRVGIELADSAARAADRARALAAITTVVDVLDYTEATAIQHARLIAAHAAQTNRTVLSYDAKARFADLPGVLAEEP
jgi:predicted nucleic acid-binding protein